MEATSHTPHWKHLNHLVDLTHQTPNSQTMYKFTPTDYVCAIIESKRQKTCIYRLTFHILATFHSLTYLLMTHAKVKIYIF